MQSNWTDSGSVLKPQQILKWPSAHFQMNIYSLHLYDSKFTVVLFWKACLTRLLLQFSCEKQCFVNMVITNKIAPVWVGVPNYSFAQGHAKLAMQRTT